MCITTEVPSLKRHQEDDDQASELMRRNGSKPSQTAQVADYMASSISVVSPEARLKEALHLITTMNVTALAVYDGRHYVGLVEAFTLKEVMQTADSRVNPIRVREIMDTTIKPCSPHDPVWGVWDRMHQAGQTYLPVIDGDGKVTGVLSSAGREDQAPAV